MRPSTRANPRAFRWQLKDEREVHYQWFKNDVAVPGANEKQLVLPSAAAVDDQALFRVVVTNAAGSTQSRQALLKVQALASVTGEVVKSELVRNAAAHA